MLSGESMLYSTIQYQQKCELKIVQSAKENLKNKI